MPQDNDDATDRTERGSTTPGIGDSQDAPTVAVPDFTRQRAVARSILRAVGLSARGSQR